MSGVGDCRFLDVFEEVLWIAVVTKSQGYSATLMSEGQMLGTYASSTQQVTETPPIYIYISFTKVIGC